MFLRLKCVCRDKHCSCLDKSCVCRDKSASVATKMCMFLSPQNLDFCRAKSGINICVTSTRFSCCDDILVKGRSYINQSKSVLLMALVHPLKMEGERNIFLLRVEAEIEIHDDILRT